MAWFSTLPLWGKASIAIGAPVVLFGLAALGGWLLIRYGRNREELNRIKVRDKWRTDVRKKRKSIREKYERTIANTPEYWAGVSPRKSTDDN